MSDIQKKLDSVEQLVTDLIDYQSDYYRLSTELRLIAQEIQRIQSIIEDKLNIHEVKNDKSI